MMMMQYLCFSFRLPLLLLFLFIISSTHSFHDDRQSLLEFKSLITGNPHQSMADWSSANPLCKWTAITCTHLQPFDRVIALNLTAMDLQGTISPSLGNLLFLHSLDLSNNALHGHIPPQLGDLFPLRVFVLDHNELEGNILPHLGCCRNLTLLALSFNNLTESILKEFSSLPYLQGLYLG